MNHGPPPLYFSLLISVPGLLSPAWALAGDLAGSGQHSLAISAGQAFGYAWGANQAGQVGTDTAGRNQSYPFRWPPGANAASATPLAAANASSPNC